jgi:hypothetical protein
VAAVEAVVAVVGEQHRERHRNADASVDLASMIEAYTINGRTVYQAEGASK